MASTIKVDKLEGSTGSTITVPTGQTLTLTDGLAVASLPVVTVAKGGTNIASFTAGDVLYATGSTTLAKLPKGTAEQVLAMNSGATAPDWGSVDLTVLPTISVAKGGTNLSSFTAGDILYATGSTTLAKLAKGTALQQIQMNAGATAPEWITASAGGLKQSAFVEFDSTFSTTTTSSWVTVTGVAVTITPTNTAHKVMGNFSMAWGTHTYDTICSFKIERQISGGANTMVHEHGSTSGGAATFRGQTHGLRAMGDNNGGNYTNLHFYDSPSTTSAITYQLKMWRTQGGTFYVNRTGNDSTSYGRGSTVITAYEISV